MKYIVYIVCLCLIMFYSCQNRHSHQDEHNHEQCEHGHDHEKDDHQHNHDSHDHNHDDHDGHEHDGHNHDHSNDGEKPASGSSESEHPDEIVFSRQQALSAGLQVKTVEPGQFTSVIKTGGQIQAAQGDEITLVAPVAGVISFSRTVAEGVPVKQGEQLLTVSSKNLLEGDPLIKARATFETAEREYSRAQSLVEDTLISRREFEQVRLSYETAKVAYDALAGNHTSNGIRTTSPIQAYVKTRWVSEGEYVNTGQPVITLTRNKRLQLKADVSERYYKNLPAIRSANFTTRYDKALYRLSDLNGQLMSYGRASDASFYVPVIFEFDNTGMMIPGSFVEVYLLAGTDEHVISIPLTSLSEEQGLHFVYLQLEEEVFKKQQVTIGDDNGQDVRILSGLKAGDKVVTQGTIQVKLAANSSVIPEGHSHSH